MERERESAAYVSSELGRTAYVRLGCRFVLYFSFSSCLSVDYNLRNCECFTL